MKSILITGVSTGIGYHTTAHFIKLGYRVFGSVRNAADASRLSEEYGSLFTGLIFDTRDGEAILNEAERTKQILEDSPLDAIINNAGIAVHGPLIHIPITRFTEQLDVNLTGVLRITQAFFPMLRKFDTDREQAGRIINIGSVSGRIGYPFLGPYSASKFGLRGFTDALRREMLIYNIVVVMIEGSNVRSAIWRKAGEEPDWYTETDYDFILKHKNRLLEQNIRQALPVEEMIKMIDKAVHTRNPSPSYLVARHPLRIKLFSKWIPARWLDIMMKKNFNKANKLRSV